MSRVADVKLPGGVMAPPTSGLPYRDIAPRIIGDRDVNDPLYRSCPGSVVEVHVLDLSTKEGVDKYAEVLNRVGSDPFMKIGHVERQWVPDRAGWMVLLEVQQQVEIGRKLEG